VAKALVNHPGVRVLSFTGSTTTGRAIAEAAARLNKKVSLEMGGKNAIIVMDDATLTSSRMLRCGPPSAPADSAAPLQAG
jgi:alpha-ketoglutaric semialdehyde dehydrogenase